MHRRPRPGTAAPWLGSIGGQNCRSGAGGLKGSTATSKLRLIQVGSEATRGDVSAPYDSCHAIGASIGFSVEQPVDRGVGRRAVRKVSCTRFDSPARSVRTFKDNLNVLSLLTGTVVFRRFGTPRRWRQSLGSRRCFGQEPLQLGKRLFRRVRLVVAAHRDADCGAYAVIAVELEDDSPDRRLVCRARGQSHVSRFTNRDRDWHRSCPANGNSRASWARGLARLSPVRCGKRS